LGLRQQRSQHQKQKAAVAAAAARTRVLEMYFDRVRHKVEVQFSSDQQQRRQQRSARPMIALNSYPFILIMSLSRNTGRLPGRTSLSRTALDWSQFQRRARDRDCESYSTHDHVRAVSWCSGAGLVAA
jgi:hypothetical protein